VRIENIYRRAAGLCQRHGYGEAVLPASMVRLCTAGECPCSIPSSPSPQPGEMHMVRPWRHVEPPTSSGDAQLQESRRTHLR
jgi:hypothetical protein